MGVGSEFGECAWSTTIGRAVVAVLSHMSAVVLSRVVCCFTRSEVVHIYLWDALKGVCVLGMFPVPPCSRRPELSFWHT